LLYEHVSPADFQKLLTSQIDGCVPLLASPPTLIDTLEMIVIENVRVMVSADAKHAVIRSPLPDESPQSEIEVEKFPSHGAGHTQSAMNGASTLDVNTSIGSTRCVPTLSERETQVLDGLVKGHANKVIARTCDITEATVKVHMKSILRKIRVGNRTRPNSQPCTRALYDATDGRPQQWRMLEELDGATTDAIVFAVAQGMDDC
jgi:two-component system, NarL family, nitrate/nitrite response regulator NarL